MKKDVLLWCAVVCAGLVCGVESAVQPLEMFSDNIWALSAIPASGKLGVGTEAIATSNRCSGVAYSGCVDSANDVDCTNITVAAYFKTRNFEAGDMVMVVNQAGYYEAYELSDKGKWAAIKTATSRTVGGQTVFEASDPATREQPRGTGFWIVRKGENSQPAYVAGQYTSASAKTPIPAGTSSMPSWTLVCPPFANPDASTNALVDVNALFAGVVSSDELKSDRIAIPQGNTGAMMVLTYRKEKDSTDWKWGYTVRTPSKNGGLTEERITNNIKVPFFWYQRFKDTPFEIDWAKACVEVNSSEKGEE